MKRKGYAEKKGLIVQAANTLFLEKGYESTSVDDILESVKISKGTFYHYFASKNEVLQSIVDNFTESFVLRLNPLVDDIKMSALQKLNTYFELNQSMKKANQALITQVIAIWYKEENLIYKERLNKSLLTALPPHLVRILNQGSFEGVFDIINPDETAVLIIQLGFCLRDRLVEEFFIKERDIKNLVEIVKTHQRGMEKILGIPEDSLTVFSPLFLIKSWEANSMQYEWLDEYCCSKKGAEKDYKEEWEATRYMLKGKMFAMQGNHRDGKAIITLKLEPSHGQLLREEYKDIIPGYYMNKEHWNSLYLEGEVPPDILRGMIDESYDIILNSLSKKAKIEILGE